MPTAISYTFGDSYFGTNCRYTKGRAQPVCFSAPSELLETHMIEMSDDEGTQLSSGVAAFEAKEFRRAWQMLEPLSDQGNANAQYRCAIMIQNGLGVIAQPKTAAILMQKAAEQNLGLAQHGLGVMYLFGEGVEKDPTEAVHWLESAGESGLAGAWSTLGMMYMEGEGVQKDTTRAGEYYEKAGFDPSEFV